MGRENLGVTVTAVENARQLLSDTKPDISHCIYTHFTYSILHCSYFSFHKKPPFRRNLLSKIAKKKLPLFYLLYPYISFLSIHIILIFYIFLLVLKKADAHQHLLFVAIIKFCIIRELIILYTIFFKMQYFIYNFSENHLTKFDFFYLY